MINSLGVAFKNMSELNGTCFAFILRTKCNSTGNAAALIPNRKMALMKDKVSIYFNWRSDIVVPAGNATC